jgi:ribosomal protein S18 acetylase RimI-like enzyme
MMSTIDVTEARSVDPELVAAFERLLPQLSSSATPLTAEDLATVIAAPGTTLFIARERGGNQQIVGTLTLVAFRTPTGVRAWIEDVVVDEAARGLGVGEQLSRTAIEKARMQGARTVELTSRPSREAANRLYQRIGFERRHTNLYRIEL